MRVFMFRLNSVVFEELVLLSLRASTVKLKRMGGGWGGGRWMTNSYLLGEERRELLDNKNSTSSETVL